MYKNNTKLNRNDLSIDLSLIYYKQKESNYQEIFSSINAFNKNIKNLFKLMI